MKIKNGVLITLLFCSVFTALPFTQEIRDLVDSLYQDYDTERAYCSQLAAVAKNKQQCMKFIRQQIQAKEHTIRRIKSDLFRRELKLFASIIANGLGCWGASFLTTDSIPIIGK